MIAVALMLAQKVIRTSAALLCSGGMIHVAHGGLTHE